MKWHGVGGWSFFTEVTWQMAELGLESVSRICTWLLPTLPPRGWGLTDGVCPSSLPRGSHEGTPALAGERDSGRTEGAGQRWHGGRSVPGKLAQRRLLLCISHQAGVLGHTLIAGNSHTPHTHTDVMQWAGQKKSTRGQRMLLIEKRGTQGILRAILNRLIVPSSPQLRDGPTGRNNRFTGNNLSQQFPSRLNHLEVQPQGQQLNKQKEAFNNRVFAIDCKKRPHVTTSPLFTHPGVTSDLTGPGVWEQPDKLSQRHYLAPFDYWTGEQTCICDPGICLPWVSYFSSLRLSFFTFKMGIRVISSLPAIKVLWVKMCPPKIHTLRS